ncbi:hypothetical protein QCN29_24300 [Streptomyces sp. HNM0663]|uniref:Secreted protein n=1 Tax=Streptomyces chengmaiensis TaxID=3040919 RepID=A0ABT6HSZ9_9ACTN|nr:hypothetical protein [Streptomyces chengmaiensis]MDH2391843.1 hypothetical protein [Streptomyces chengmaiensis]
MRRLSPSVVVAALLLAGVTPASPFAPSPASAHTGCAATDRDGRGEWLVGLAREVKRELDLNSALFCVAIRGEEVVTAALGHSMTGLSPASYRTMLDPGAVGLGGPTDRCPETVCRAQTEERHYGLGNVILNSWVVQNPLFNGFAAQQSHLPSRGIAIAVATTVGADSPTGNTASTVARRLAEVLAPDQPLG